VTVQKVLETLKPETSGHHYLWSWSWDRIPQLEMHTSLSEQTQVRWCADFYFGVCN